MYNNDNNNNDKIVGKYRKYCVTNSKPDTGDDIFLDSSSIKYN